MLIVKNHLIFSNGDVKLKYTSKPYFVNMTTTQMSVLLQFNKSDTLSFLELQEITSPSCQIKCFRSKDSECRVV